MSNTNDLQNSFVNLIEELNSISKTILNDSKINAKSWAKIAAEKSFITHSMAHEIETLVNLRNQISHGSAGRLNITQHDLDTIKKCIDVANQTAHQFKNRNRRSNTNISYDNDSTTTSKDYRGIIFNGSEAQRVAIANSQIGITNMKKDISIASSSFDNLHDIIENDFSLEEKIDLFERYSKVKDLGKGGVWNEQYGKFDYFAEVDNPKLYWKVYIVKKKISNENTIQKYKFIKIYITRFEAFATVKKNSNKLKMEELLIPKYSIYRISNSAYVEYRTKEKIIEDIVKAIEYINKHPKLYFEAITPSDFETILLLEPTT